MASLSVSRIDMGLQTLVVICLLSFSHSLDQPSFDSDICEAYRASCSGNGASMNTGNYYDHNLLKQMLTHQENNNNLLLEIISKMSTVYSSPHVERYSNQDLLHFFLESLHAVYRYSNEYADSISEAYNGMYKVGYVPREWLRLGSDNYGAKVVRERAPASGDRFYNQLYDLYNKGVDTSDKDDYSGAWGSLGAYKYGKPAISSVGTSDSSWLYGNSADDGVSSWLSGLKGWSSLGFGSSGTNEKNDWSQNLGGYKLINYPGTDGKTSNSWLSGTLSSYKSPTYQISTGDDWLSKLDSSKLISYPAQSSYGSSSLVYPQVSTSSSNWLNDALLKDYSGAKESKYGLIDYQTFDKKDDIGISNPFKIDTSNFAGSSYGKTILGGNAETDLDFGDLKKFLT